MTGKHEGLLVRPQEFLTYKKSVSSRRLYFLTPRCEPSIPVRATGIADWDHFTRLAFGTQPQPDRLVTALGSLDAARDAITTAFTQPETAR